MKQVSTEKKKSKEDKLINYSTDRKYSEMCRVYWFKHLTQTGFALSSVFYDSERKVLDNWTIGLTKYAV